MVIHVIMTGHNVAPWIGDAIKSVLRQEVEEDTLKLKFTIVDDASTDRTLNEIPMLFFAHHNGYNVISNKHRVGALANIYNAVHSMDDDEIVLQVDADDMLVHDQAIAKIHHVFELYPETWFLHAGYSNTDGSPSRAAAYASGDFRNEPFSCVGLRAFKAGLFKKIRREDLEIGGFWQTSSWDVAMCLPMMEMAGIERIKFIPDVLYSYRIHEKNDRAVDERFQQFCYWVSKQRDPYNRLISLDQAPEVKPVTMGPCRTAIMFAPHAKNMPKKALGLVAEHDGNGGVIVRMPS